MWNKWLDLQKCICLFAWTNTTNHSTTIVLPSTGGLKTKVKLENCLFIVILWINLKKLDWCICGLKGMSNWKTHFIIRSKYFTCYTNFFCSAAMLVFRRQSVWPDQEAVKCHSSCFELQPDRRPCLSSWSSKGQRFWSLVYHDWYSSYS